MGLPHFIIYKIMALDLKTYVIAGSPARLAALLTALGYPFYFNGTEIEITCEKWYLAHLKQNDPKLFEKVSVRMDE